MKLLHIITSLEIGGAQRLLSDLLPIQKAQGFDVSILVNKMIDNDLTNKIKSAGVELISLNKSNGYSFSNVFQLRKIMQLYDVVHVHLFPSLYWAAIASIGLKTKMVYTEHSTYNRRRKKLYFRPIEKFVYKHYDKIISISKHTQEALQQWLQASDERFVIINNGIDIQHFSAIHRPIISKSLIMISRFAESKDQETLIRAMKYIDIESVLRLVGDGKNKKHCEQIAKEEGVADRIYFLGARPNIAELIAESYIGVQSSNWEGFGLTAVELMAAGKPVIASDVDGLKQIVEGAGVIFPKGNVKELARYISLLLDNKSYYESIVNKCKKRALLYDIEKMAMRYKDVYCELLKK